MTVRDMPRIDRRSALKLALGATVFHFPANEVAATEGGRQALLLDPYGRGPIGRDELLSPNPVLFWNDASLQLVALDHSIDAKELRTPGPCATARALALVHCVMADALACVSPVPFGGYFIRQKVSLRGLPDAFIGGAVSGMLQYIYNTPAHAQLIASQRRRFLGQFDREAMTAWDAGLEFAFNETYISRWNWPTIHYALVGAPGLYSRGPHSHDVDPFNPDQGFYGARWSRIAPLALRFGDFAFVAPGAPPRETDSEYVRDLREVAELGMLHPGGPTPEQVNLGLFWAYDGARLIGSPPRLYNQIIRQVAQSDGMSVADTARLFALCNLAMADAGTVCWTAKYYYNIWRPVLGVPYAFGKRVGEWLPFGAPRTNPAQFASDQNAQTYSTAQSMMGGGEFRSLPAPTSGVLSYRSAAFTPNFPSYPSGHASFGAACFNMLRRVRAERALTRSFPDRIDHADPFISAELDGVSIDNFRNVPRPFVPIRYESIQQMICDNSRSRVHLGVHWNFDCDRGERSGARVAEWIYRRAYVKLD